MGRVKAHASGVGSSAALDTPPGEIKQTGIKSINAGDYEISLDTSIKRIMRLDRVSFPLRGEALTHIHAAPGVRCMLAGNLLLDSVGHRYRAWPGDSWVEHGPDHVYAKASENELSSFVRVMIVPEEYRGRSTITYVRADDRTNLNHRHTSVTWRNQLLCDSCLLHWEEFRDGLTIWPRSGQGRTRRIRF